MKLRLHDLVVVCKKAREVVELVDVTYFHGEIGAGKSSIAHLIDYCLGATLEETPAMQSEFVQAELSLSVGDVPLTLVRSRNAAMIHASWEKDGKPFDVNLPARQANGEVLPGTGVEVLSDLVFHLAGMKPPRVRKSKAKDDSDLVRLSLRDLLRYCYLDQAEMESTFFALEASADFAVRNKSKDVLRFVLGYHQERLSELEQELDDLRVRRRAHEDSARTLREALAESGVGSVDEIDKRMVEIDQERSGVLAKIKAVVESGRASQQHGADVIRERARGMLEEVRATEESIAALEKLLQGERAHLNELISLGVRFRRSDAARSVLRGVSFVDCPECMQKLPPRSVDACRLCSQPRQIKNVAEDEITSAEADLKAREIELRESIERRETQLRRFRRSLEDQRQQKRALDDELSDALAQYDSITMSARLELEHEKARLEQERVRQLPLRVDEMLRAADTTKAEESRVRRDLSEARAVAERDATSLRDLEHMFRDCLVRSKMPGVTAEHVVSIPVRSLYPSVAKPGEEDLITATHANLSSGGKVTIFKCCFAVALHRLAAKKGATLPTLLMIDTPMKNISERTDRAIFEAFYTMIYELAATELRDRQLVLIDKEFFPPPKDFARTMKSRYMTPADETNPPLISYYRD